MKIGLILLVTCLGVPVVAQQRPPVFRANIDAVRIDVSAIDNGHPIAGLRADDFEVRDNGVLQSVDLVTTAGSLSVVIALDVQGNDAWPHANVEMIRAAQALADAVKPVDRAWLITFADTFDLQTGPTSNAAQLRRLLTQAQPGRGKTLWDTLFAGVSLVADTDGRAVVMVVSDGFAPPRQNGWLDEPHALDLLKRGDVMISALQPRAVVVSPTALERAAKATGGVVIETARNDRLTEQCATLFDQYRSSYVLTFTPAGVKRDDGWHKLTVRLKNHSGQTRSRDAYFAGLR